MGGYPDRAGSLAALRVLAQAGVDVIELGIPYSDPLADGPVIREAADAALGEAAASRVRQLISTSNNLFRPIRVIG